MRHRLPILALRHLKVGTAALPQEPQRGCTLQPKVAVTATLGQRW